jgi:hypothetical protein
MAPRVGFRARCTRSTAILPTGGTVARERVSREPQRIGVEGLLANGWEWTSSIFEPFLIGPSPIRYS